MYHWRFVYLKISNNSIDIKMGPLKWFFLEYFFSSHITKEEIVSIEYRRRDACCWDIFPRFYCYPVSWCCCHKSYSSYFWPFCCICQQCTLLGCKDDQDTSEMITIHLTKSPLECCSMCCKRCSPGTTLSFLSIFSLCWCCVYNRISVSIKDASIIKELKSNGYELEIGKGIDSNETEEAGGNGTWQPSAPTAPASQV